VVDGHVYGFDNATFRCLRLADGEQVWAKRGLGKGTVIAGDGLLIVYSDRGEAVLATASPEGYQEKGRLKVYDVARTWTPPTLAGGHLYLRGGDELACFDIGG
jgi:outer membrane protein assembly factor BamB